MTNLLPPHEDSGCCFEFEEQVLSLYAGDLFPVDFSRPQGLFAREVGDFLRRFPNACPFFPGNFFSSKVLCSWSFPSPFI